MPSASPPPVLSVREVAELKDVSVQAAHAAAKRGALTTYRSAGTVLVVRDAKLDAYLASTPTKPVEDA